MPYWGFRIDVNCQDSPDYYVKELNERRVLRQGWEDRFKGPVSAVMKSLNERIEASVYKALLKQFEGSEWEYALAIGLKALFPHYGVKRTGGAGEQKHGTDILITMPGPLPNVQYGIAMQVKDRRDTAFDVSDAVDQVKKADEGWKELRPGLRIIDKIVVVTGAAIPDDEQRERDGVTILVPRDLKELLRRMAVATAAARDE